tara:strand:- start:526 stop:1485 length:960 start_codon:yes stop_codon:yes gene_type:complete
MVYHIIGHQSDPDGIISHALLRRSLLNNKDKDHSNEQMIHYFTDYAFLRDLLDKVKSSERGKIFVADLSLDENICDETLFQQLSTNHDSLAWFDHHEPSIENKDFLDHYCNIVSLASNKCAAVLVQESYSPNNKYDQFLAHLAQVTDFERRDDQFSKQAYGLHDIIASGYNLKSLVEDLAEEKVVNKKGFINGYQTVIDDFKIKKEEAYINLEKSISYQCVNGYVFAFAFSEPLLYMKLATEYLKERLKVDGIIVVYDGKPNVLAHGKKDLGKRIPQFCKIQGGGGRGHGGGFLLNHDINQETFQADIEYIKNNLEQFF